MEDNSQSYNNTNETQLDSSTNENTSVTLIRTGYSREAFNSTFNTDFTQLGVNEQDLTFFAPNIPAISTCN